MANILTSEEIGAATPLDFSSYIPRLRAYVTTEGEARDHKLQWAEFTDEEKAGKTYPQISNREFALRIGASSERVVKAALVSCDAFTFDALCCGAGILPYALLGDSELWTGGEDLMSLLDVEADAADAKKAKADARAAKKIARQERQASGMLAS